MSTTLKLIYGLSINKNNSNNNKNNHNNTKATKFGTLRAVMAECLNFVE